MAKKGVLQFLNADGTFSDGYPKTTYDKVDGLDDHVKTIKVNNATTADKATGDKNGVDLTGYLKSASVSFPTLTVMNGAGTASSLLMVPDGAAAHNALYRGKDLTSYFTSGDMSKAISAGTFRDIFPGDYVTKSVTINGTTYSNVKWLVADCDYHLGCGDSETTAHHVVLIAETPIFQAVMNDTNITTGGYIGSKMWGTTMPLVTTGIQNAFGSDHVLKHRELLSKTESGTVASGAGAGWTGGTTDWGWYDVNANIMNEVMVYGTRVLSSSFFDVGDCNRQLAIFQHNKNLMSRRGGMVSGTYWGYWLRAVASSTIFCLVDAYGSASAGEASCANIWVRPYFLFH